MGRIVKHRLCINNHTIRDAEEYIEKLFREWSINEVYLGNVVTSFSNLIPLLIDYPGDGNFSFTAQLKDEVLSFDFKGIDSTVLTMFLKDYLLQDISDNSSQSVFLIQKITDKISVEGENLVLQFNTGALPAAYLNHRKHVLKISQEEIHEKVIND
jgi:hypothetical protein